MNETLASAVAGAREALGSAGEIRGRCAGGAPRFELFHGANSICSQKVRSVLAQHALAYVSHPVNMFLGQTYLPAYVRLRMIGCERLGGALVAHHSGSTSTSAGGCDGAVVPTLVDWQTDDVIVDSRRICHYLDEQAPEANTLRPSHLAVEIDRQLDIVDNLPNYQMLMGRTPSASEGTATKDGVGNSFSQKKVAWCDHYLGENPTEAPLVAAYSAKRAKELSAANELFSAEAMEGAYARANMALDDLEQLLEHRQDAWLFGASVTMADLFWGIELLRMRNMGVATFWENGKLPQVEQFGAATKVLPAIHTAITAWPGALF